jgi:hydroxymethylpyrimidine kinase/phosphomethylpyrimidine kinase
MTKIALTIAGVDPSGGAGVYADIKTFAAFGCFPTAAITSITFQNTSGVFGAEHQSAESLRRQIEPIIDDFHVDAVKTGMLPTEEIIRETARLISDNGMKNIVVDPVVRSTSGFDLIDNAALRSLIELLFPLSDIVTPNVPEAERISGVAIESEEDVGAAAEVIRSMGARNVLIKGGHFPARSESKERLARDHLFVGDERLILDAEYIDTTSTHGTGCVLAAAIAANLARGNGLVLSVEIAKKFVNDAIRNAPNIGKGHSPIDPSHRS